MAAAATTTLGIATRINYSDQLFFICVDPDDNYWTPAVLFPNYGAVLKDLHQSLTPHQRYTLCRQLMATGNAGPVAQVLENGTFCLLNANASTTTNNNNMTRPYFLNLQEVWEQTNKETVGSARYKNWLHGMEEVDKILAKELMNEETNNTTSIEHPPPPVALKKRKHQDTKTNTVPARKAICFKKSDKKKKKKDINKSSKTVKENSREDDFYVFSHVWSILKERGWTYTRAVNPLHSWYWLAPDCKDKYTGILGENMFVSEDEVLAYCKRIDLKGQVKNDQHDSSNNDNVHRSHEQGLTIITTPKHYARTKPQDPSVPRIINENEEIKNSPDRFHWAVLWPRLQRFGWTVKSAAQYNPLHDFYYVRPNKNPATGILGEDFFMSTTDVINYEKEMEQQGNGNGKIKGKSDFQVKLESRRITMSPPYIASFDKKPFRREWFHKDSLPNFLKLWFSVLSTQLNFTFSNGSYQIPGNAQHFPTVHELRQHLVKYGIPNADKLNSDNEALLYRWITFCHVPVKDTTSRIKLQHVEVMDDDTAKMLLCQHGMTISKTTFSFGPTLQFSSLAEVRVYVRATEELLPSFGRRRGTTKVMKVTEQEMLELRVWAAMAPDALPVYGEH